MRPSGVVLWQRLADQLAGEIADGTLPSGSRLPPEPELAARFNVNRHTVRRAVASLAEMGLISIEHGRGTFVAATNLLNYPVGPRTRFTEIISRQSKFPSARLVRAAVVPAYGRMMEDLKLAEGADCVLLETLHFADSRPLNLAAHYFPADRFRGIDEAFERVKSITAALREFGVMDYSRRLTRVSTRLPSSSEANLLRQARGKPVLVFETVNIDEAGTPIEFGIGRCAGDAMQLVFET